MRTARRFSALGLFAALLGSLLAACGGGGGDGGGGPVVAPQGLTYNYKTVSLVGSPSFVLTSNSLSTAAAGTVTLGSGTVTDVVGYTLATATGVITAASPFAVSGDLKQALLMVCKPAASVDGNVLVPNAGLKLVHVSLPEAASVGTIDDLKGKTLDTFDNCAPSTSRVVFDGVGGGLVFTGSAATGTAFTASFFATLLTEAGLTTRSGTLPNITLDVDTFRVFKSGDKVYVVARSVQTPASENTWGSLGVWVSR